MPLLQQSVGTAKLSAVTVAALTAAAAGGVLLTVAHLYKRYRYWNSPFVAAGRVERLFLHPIKSCASVETSFLDCVPRGPRNGWLSDREFIVIDVAHEGLFLTARAYPRMVLIRAQVLQNQLAIQFPDSDGFPSRTVEIDLVAVKERNDIRMAALHGGKKTAGYDCGDEIGEVLTDFLGLRGKRELRLLRFSADLFTERHYRSFAEAWHNPVPQILDEPAYVDKTSYTANTAASLVNLNAHLNEGGFDKVDAMNFRPNIFIGALDADNKMQPFDEDRWLDVRIGDVEFVCVQAISRCVETTVNPVTGEMAKSGQPLAMLRDYRLAPKGRLYEFYKNSPLFGVHMALRRPGRIRVGDTVFVRYKPYAL